jgi:hypothetical protein
MTSIWTDGREAAMVASTAGSPRLKSPPTRRVMDVLAALADSVDGKT